MTLSTRYARLKSAVLGAAALALAAIGAAPAAAQGKGDQRFYDIFVGVYADKEKPIVIFTLSDSKTPKYDEVVSHAFFAVKGYDPKGKKFSVKDGCRFAPAYLGRDKKSGRPVWKGAFSVTQLSPKFKLDFDAKPIYGPNSSQDIIDPFSLPSYLAREAVKKLLKGKYVKDEASAKPYFNCAGWLTARLTDQDKSFWNELLKNKIEETKKQKK